MNLCIILHFLYKIFYSNKRSGSSETESGVNSKLNRVFVQKENTYSIIHGFSVTHLPE